MDQAKIIQGISLYDMVTEVQRKNKLFQKQFLDHLEIIMGKNSPEFIAVRKLYLDTQNEFARNIVNSLFGGDIEN